MISYKEVIKLAETKGYKAMPPADVSHICDETVAKATIYHVNRIGVTDLHEEIELTGIMIWLYFAKKKQVNFLVFADLLEKPLQLRKYMKNILNQLP